VIVRAANSVDIYCSKKNNEDLLLQTAVDFKQNPVLFLYNQSILTKCAGATDWDLLGRVSSRGFNHRTRYIQPYGPAFDAPYQLHPGNGDGLARPARRL
jgi:hypothetical protein